MSPVLSIPTSPGAVGVTGGVFGVVSGSIASMLVPSGTTGPGRALKGFASGVSRRRMSRSGCDLIITGPSTASKALGIMLFLTCASPV